MEASLLWTRSSRSVLLKQLNERPERRENAW